MVDNVEQRIGRVILKGQVQSVLVKEKNEVVFYRQAGQILVFLVVLENR